MKIHIQLSFLALLAVSAASAVAQQSSAPSAQKGLAGLFSSAKEDELVEPDLAFKFKVAARGPQTLAAELLPAKGYYLYKERIRFSLKDAGGASIAAVKLPAGDMKNDQIFGKTEVFHAAVPIEIVLKDVPKNGQVALVASYQGCHEKLGVCYPPIEKMVKLALPQK